MTVVDAPAPPDVVDVAHQERHPPGLFLVLRLHAGGRQSGLDLRIEGRRNTRVSCVVDVGQFGCLHLLVNKQFAVLDVGKINSTHSFSVVTHDSIIPVRSSRGWRTGALVETGDMVEAMDNRA